MSARHDLTQEALREALSYDAETGAFKWRVGKGNVVAGTIAGSVRRSTGYHEIRINGHRYHSHRLAWLYVHGKWPRAMVDHIDGNKTNNRIANLREATRSQNMAAAAAPKDAVVGVKGVRRKGKRYAAQIGKDGKSYWLGTFDTIEEAAAAYDNAAKRLYGEYAHHRKIFGGIDGRE